MTQPYTPQNIPWADGAAGGTPLNAAALNGIEAGIVNASTLIVDALPGSPDHGQEILYEAATGILWRLVYDSTIVDDHKWLGAGGPQLEAEVQTAETTASTSYVDLATVGPSVTAPLAGVYEIEITAAVENNTAAASSFVSPKIGSATASDNDSAVATSAVANARTQVSRRIRRTLAASDVIKLQARATAGTGTFRNRGIAIRPVRVS